MKEYRFSNANRLTLRTRLVLLRHSKLFSVTTTAIIIIYSIMLGLETHIEQPYLLRIFSVLDMLVTLYFVIEISIKIYVEKNKIDFFKDKWNLFDFIIVMLSVVPLSSIESVAIARLFRIFRVLRLIAINDNIKKLLTALEGAIPSIVNIVILMFIVFYIYAILGNDFFGDLKSGLWSDFSISMLTLFRIFTFEDWTDVMYEAMEVHPFAWIYFVSFIIINVFIIFNLFVAVIIDEISKIKDNDINTFLKNEDEGTQMIMMQLKQIEKEILELKKEIQK